VQTPAGDAVAQFLVATQVIARASTETMRMSVARYGDRGAKAEITDGIYLYHRPRSSPIPVVIHNTGTVASIAATLFVAGERRICCPHSIFMMHLVAMPANGNMASELLRSALGAARQDEIRTESILRERATIPEDILIARRTRDIFITAEDALAYGLVHETANFTLLAGNKIFQI
jgi:ATP-dependent Clp protease protease subunit